MKYQSEQITEIWSPLRTKRMMEQVWEQTMDWLLKSGFKDAKRIDATIADRPYKLSGHEVVDALRDYVAQTGYVNAHAGLTSSDVVDNVRLGQCEMSRSEIEGLRIDLKMKLRNFASPRKCLGYTHWQPAAYTTWANRFNAHAESLGGPGPIVFAKRMGGATNTRSAMEILCGQQPPMTQPVLTFGTTELPCGYEYGWQSSYHVDELRQAQWLEHLMAVVHKLAQDIRFLCHTGELMLHKEDSYRGSSAMPGKVNPIEAEQVCSLARRQPNFTRQIWDAMAFNGMERTLDTSAILRVTLPEMYQNAAYCLETTLDLLGKVWVNVPESQQILEQNSRAAYIENNMAARISAGESRIEVYEDLQIKH